MIHQLAVRNNLQKKRIKVESTKIGLTNIAEKFCVTVPLIAPNFG